MECTFNRVQRWTSASEAMRFAPIKAGLLLLLAGAGAVGCASELADPKAEVESRAAALTDTCEPDQPTTDCPTGGSPQAICPPGPPKCGPGSAQSSENGINIRSYSSSRAGVQYKYTIYEPAREELGTAPVIFHLHGWYGHNAAYYDAYLSHLVLHGYVAVFVQYYTNAAATGGFERNARTAISDALTRLEGNVAGDVPHVRPQHDPQTDGALIALSGHSLGGILALRLAGRPDTSPAIPTPRAIVLHDPSTDIWGDTESFSATIDPESYLMVIREDITADTWSDEYNYSYRAFTGTTIPLGRRNLLGPQSDATGEPATNDLVSNHFASAYIPPLGGSIPMLPTNGDPLDALDFWGYWRPSEGTFNVAFGREQANAGYDPFCYQKAPACESVHEMGSWVQGNQAIAPVKAMLNAGDIFPL